MLRTMVGVKAVLAVAPVEYIASLLVFEPTIAGDSCNFFLEAFLQSSGNVVLPSLF